MEKKSQLATINILFIYLFFLVISEIYILK